MEKSRKLEVAFTLEGVKITATRFNVPAAYPIEGFVVDTTGQMTPVLACKERQENAILLWGCETPEMRDGNTVYRGEDGKDYSANEIVYIPVVKEPLVRHACREGTLDTVLQAHGRCVQYPAEAEVTPDTIVRKMREKEYLGKPHEDVLMELAELALMDPEEVRRRFAGDMEHQQAFALEST